MVVLSHYSHSPARGSPNANWLSPPGLASSQCCVHRAGGQRAGGLAASERFALDL